MAPRGLIQMHATHLNTFFKAFKTMHNFYFLFSLISLIDTHVNNGEASYISGTITILQRASVVLDSCFPSLNEVVIC